MRKAKPKKPVKKQKRALSLFAKLLIFEALLLALIAVFALGGYMLIEA